MRFYLFDCVTGFSPGAEASGIKNVSSQEDFLINHFDRSPVMPAPLIAESLAQLGGWAITVSSGYRHLAVMVRLNSLAVTADARPGDQIHLHVSIDAVNEYGARVVGTASVRGAEILKVGTITYVLYEIPEQDRTQVKYKYNAVHRR
jgi:3-hydroxymyristoyl/3-hydroxydecanoyl-(acyl carrier protein) dehydratase